MATESFSESGAPADFSDMTDDELDSYRQAAVAEIAARGEKQALFKQAENVIITAQNRGYSEQEVSESLNNLVSKVYSSDPPSE